MVSSSSRLIASVKPRFASEITRLVPVRPRSYFLAAALDLAVAVAHGNAEHLAVVDRHQDSPLNHLHACALSDSDTSDLGPPPAPRRGAIRASRLSVELTPV